MQSNREIAAEKAASSSDQAGTATDLPSMGPSFITNVCRFVRSPALDRRMPEFSGS